jgi:hypothetical protein
MCVSECLKTRRRALLIGVDCIAERNKRTTEKRAELQAKDEELRATAEARARAALVADEARAGAAIDVVTGSGRGPQGALKVLQRSVRPSVRNALPLPACGAVFTLYAGADAAHDDADAHSLLVLSTPSEQYEFVDGCATLNAFNVFGRTKIAQGVCLSGLLTGKTK